MCSRESTRAFSASDYRETTFLTIAHVAFLLTCVHFGIVTKKSITARAELALAAILLNAKNLARERRGKEPGAARGKWDAETTLCLLRNADVPWGILFQGEKVSAAAVRNYFRCGSLLVCRWAFATTFGAALSASDRW